jgi:hypothetical protein
MKSYLSSGMGEHLGIRIGGSSIHVSLMRKQIGSSPQKLDPGPLLLLLHEINYLVKILIGFFQGGTLWGNLNQKGKISGFEEIMKIRKGLTSRSWKQ